jgi:aminoglycoside 6-adenylyltransferase
MWDEVTERLLEWASARPDVWAIVLTSSRARSDGRVDELSDHDVIVAVTEPEAFADDEDWQHELGAPVVRWGDDDVLGGMTTWFRGVIYDDGSKLDFTFWPRQLLAHVATLDALPAELDAGYCVLLDKDGATQRWARPTFHAYIPTPPSAERYRTLVEEFLWGATYAAKALRRGQLMFARSFVVEHDMRLEALARFLEWSIEIDRGWALPLDHLGRRFEELLPSALRAELEATYAGPGIEENWDALMRLMTLFRRVAIDVGRLLGFAYPADAHDRIVAVVTAIRRSGG